MNQLTADTDGLVLQWREQFLSHFKIEFAFQPKHFARARVVGKQFTPAVVGWIPAGGLIPLYSKQVLLRAARWTITIQAPHGQFEVEVSEQFYNLVRKGNVVQVEYRLSRLYGTNQRVSGKLLL